jgi:tetratricopeptide (TPR) repeat protein
MTEPSQRRNLVICLSLAAVIALVYSPIRRYGFVSVDDELYIIENAHLRKGLTLKGLGWALTTPLDQWMPLTWSARMLEYQLFGLDAGAYHVVNVLFHIANTLLLFAVLTRMTAAPWRSGAVAALFALHPLHVESVAWVTGLKDVLSVFFGLLTIWAYVRYVEKLSAISYQPSVRTLPAHCAQDPAAAAQGSKPKAQDPRLASPQSGIRGPRSASRDSRSSILWYVVALLFFALALMSKPMVVTLPFVLLLLDYWPLGRTRWARSFAGKSAESPPRRLLTEKLPLFALSAASCVATLWAQHAVGALASLGREPFGIRIANAVLSYGGYLGKMLWPTRLAVFYPVDLKPSLALVMVVSVGLAAVTAVVMGRARREPWLATGWFWYLGTLAPVSGLVQVGVVEGLADRYTYVPLIGLFIMLCWSVPRNVMGRQNARAIICLAAGTGLAVCAVLSGIQIRFWKDSMTLFRHALDVTRDNWLAYNNLGNVLDRAGKTHDAVEAYPQAVRIRPGYAKAHYNLGHDLAKIGRLDEAMGHWDQAVRLKPDFAEAQYNLGVALLGTGKAAEAIGHLEEALRLNPDSAEAHNSLATAFTQVGRMQEAIAQYEQALQIAPGSAEYHHNLAIALFRAERLRNAVAQCERALQLEPDFAQAHFTLGVILTKMGRTQGAIAHYQEAIRLNPDLVAARNELSRLQAGP